MLFNIPAGVVTDLPSSHAVRSRGSSVPTQSSSHAYLNWHRRLGDPLVSVRLTNLSPCNSSTVRLALRAGELRALLLGLAINVAGSHVHDLDADVHYLMGEFDSDKDGSVSRSEFHAALLR